MDPEQVAARLHDGPVQAMTAAMLLLGAAQQRLDPDDDVHALLQRAATALGTASAQCRDLMRDLRDDEGP